MDYSSGKIYAIIDNTNDSVYIGSTKQNLSGRLGCHRRIRRDEWRECASRVIIDNGDYRIQVLEHYPCETRDQLCWREQYWLDLIPNINKNRAINTREDTRRKDNEYNKNHAGKYKAWKENNRDHVKEYAKDRYQYKRTWGSYSDNNLLEIDPDLFF